MAELQPVFISDTLHNLIAKFQYLTNAHYGYLRWVQELGSVEDSELTGFTQVFEGLHDEFLEFEKHLDPHIDRLIELNRASTPQQ